MPVHYFVRLRPPPGDGRGIREITIGSRRFSADEGWVFLERGFAVSLKREYHPDHKARAAFSYAFEVESMDFTDVLPHWIVSAGRAADTEYEACVNSLPWNENEFEPFEYAGHVFTAEAGWLRVSREEAEFLDRIPTSINRKPQQKAFFTRVAQQSPAVTRPAAIGPGSPAGSPVTHIARDASMSSAVAAPVIGVPVREEDEESDSEPADVPGPESDASPGGEQDTGASGMSFEERVLAPLRSGPLATSEIAHALGLNGVSGHLKSTVQALVERHAIELTIPDKPASRLQKYRLIEQGIVTSSASPTGGDRPSEATLPAAAVALDALRAASDHPAPLEGLDESVLHAENLHENEATHLSTERNP